MLASNIPLIFALGYTQSESIDLIDAHMLIFLIFIQLQFNPISDIYKYRFTHKNKIDKKLNYISIYILNIIVDIFI